MIASHVSSHSAAPATNTGSASAPPINAAKMFPAVSVMGIHGVAA